VQDGQKAFELHQSKITIARKVNNFTSEPSFAQTFAASAVIVDLQIEIGYMVPWQCALTLTRQLVDERDPDPTRPFSEYRRP
jgi:hypothetical protein